MIDCPGHSVLFVPKKVGSQVCEYIHARAIYNVLTQGRTVQKGWSNLPTPGKSHPAWSQKLSLRGIMTIIHTYEAYAIRK